jgi:hypothetical protein
MVRPVLVQERLRGWRHSGWSSGRRRGPIRGCRRREPVRGTVVVVATSGPRVLQQHRGCRLVPGMELQWLGWPHRADSDGDDRLRRPDVTTWPCVVTEKAFEGDAGPPSRARRVSRTGVGGAVSRD